MNAVDQWPGNGFPIVKACFFTDFLFKIKINDWSFPKFHNNPWIAEILVEIWFSYK
jgi:hypothetical protein